MDRTGSEVLTVGIPTYNRSAWLKEAVESVLSQSYTDFRLIISDNASDDDTPQVIAAFADDRIEYVRLDTNVGALRNLNGLIERTTTPFLLLLPDDDVLFPGHLEASMRLLQQHDSIGAVHSAYHRIDDQSRIIGRVDPVSCSGATTIERRDSAMERLMTSNSLLGFPSVIYRTQAISAAGGFQEDLGLFCDRTLWMRMVLDWDLGYLAEPLVGQRAHPQTATAGIASDGGDASGRHAQSMVYAQMNFDQRIGFLGEAAISRSRFKRLRALATLQLLIDEAYAGLGSGDVAARLAQIVRDYPPSLMFSPLWRLVLAQMGGRRIAQSSRGLRGLVGRARTRATT
jgi:glycosyltransferase involved in cell wall biosynthesis